MEFIFTLNMAAVPVTAISEETLTAASKIKRKLINDGPLQKCFQPNMAGMLGKRLAVYPNLSPFHMPFLTFYIPKP